ncbi:benzaldehyde dehydrogenase [Nocardia amikacinitolerans]|uniref:benzaldehyde dehydrogenase n=1 Tax=Nocardia amikacinitolerans TaxID=756689 RepID=UPI0020A5F9C7|nr:benzaldehyde dehydrogenase [Nocardia amikacinitolerans]MCP2280820.1 benzaldehyde dehydrogenase (NAD) [Nocardia amikacinitolerans]MCP2299868.1 benzaldehyde dehydrogenase (NAD) [Nocardia amikacinitolerans]
MAGLLGGDHWHNKIYSNGWIDSAGGVLKVTEPATGEVLAGVGLANASDIDRAAERAAAAQPGWAAVVGPERAAVFRKAAMLLDENRDEIVRWLVRETGSTQLKAGFEVELSLAELWEAAALPTQPSGQVLPSASEARHSIAYRVPLGVVGVITPWNFPLYLALRAVAPALALGNAVVLKPDEQTAVVGGVALAELFERAGLPDGVLQVMAGDAEPGQALCENPRVAMVSFTGSSEVGRMVGASAGRTLKRLSLELGGNNALIILDDADLDVASSAGAWGAFAHQGQICMAAGRHIVLESVADEYIDRIAKRAAALTVGDPNKSDVALGPLINERQAANAERIVTQTIAAGAALRAGGTRDGLFFQPTVLAGVTAAMPAFREEIFGPVAPVIVVGDEDEAIAAANDTEYGLVAAVQTGSPERGHALAQRLRTGVVHVNDQTVNVDNFSPFGGIGASGNGSRFGAPTSWDEFTQWRWVTSRAKAQGYPF